MPVEFKTLKTKLFYKIYFFVYVIIGLYGAYLMPSYGKRFDHAGFSIDLLIFIISNLTSIFCSVTSCFFAYFIAFSKPIRCPILFWKIFFIIFIFYEGFIFWETLPSEQTTFPFVLFMIVGEIIFFIPLLIPMFRHAFMPNAETHSIPQT
jgi:hypothetical protein